VTEARAAKCQIDTRRAPPLAGVRVLEYAQYVAGPLCGVVLGDLGADVVKVEPPAGDGYRHVMPVAPGLGRYFVPLNRGKRSVVLDLKAEDGRERSRALVSRADVVIHNYTATRAAAFGLDWESLHAAMPGLVVGVVTSFGESGPLAGTPAYDLVAQARSGLLTAHAGPGDTVPVRAGGIPLADLTAGYLLAIEVLAALAAARASGVGRLVDVSLLAAALAAQVQDLVWLEGEAGESARTATADDLAARAEEIGGGLAMNPYYRCYEARDGFVAVACLNVAQRRAFAALFDMDDPTIEAPDLVPDDPEVLALKRRLTGEIERSVAGDSVAALLGRLEAAGVPASPVLVRESVHADPQVQASGLVAAVDQPGLGPVQMLRSLVGSGSAAPAPELGADTEAVLGALA
jgi:crotonobetainyl-CoA:carnitine CoA-transferase CaiB-like acyl-CoA transferase